MPHQRIIPIVSLPHCWHYIFGMLGAHKFYLGQSGMGVLYLGLSLGGVILSCLVIPLAGPIVIAIVSIVEGLVYLSYSERGFRERFGS